MCCNIISVFNHIIDILSRQYPANCVIIESIETTKETTMGVYINPGNAGFEAIKNGEYIDKTGLIALINQNMGKAKNLICISRPRRFGKSYAAQMLCAYYDCSCDSSKLFDNLDISKDKSYISNLNNFNVVSLDITGFLSELKASGTSVDDVSNRITTSLYNEIKSLFPEVSECQTLSECFIKVAELTNRKFVFVIDEWDAVIREARYNTLAQDSYLNLLRGWFKNNNFTPKVVAAAYMTGILPIKKDGSQSAISDFEEYTMLKPRSYGYYVGFTEPEVKSLCSTHGLDFDIMKNWYDGYFVKDTGSIYNPNSVMKAISYNDFDSYWVETSASESLMEYICKDYNGLTKTIAELIGGIRVPVNTTGFANDFTTFKGKDDVLTLLVHLGYLAYDSEEETVYIPNEEIKREFSKTIREVKHEETLSRISDCDKLFKDTIHGNEEAVAAQIEKIHAEETSPLNYNNEESLRSVIKLAYYTYKDNYIKFEELPSGNGYADIVYIPKKNSDYPILIIELKWNKSAEGAIAQIKSKKYPDSLKDLGSDILLVGINYNKDSNDKDYKKHTCKIERT